LESVGPGLAIHAYSGTVAAGIAEMRVECQRAGLRIEVHDEQPVLSVFTRVDDDSAAGFTLIGPLRWVGFRLGRPVEQPPPIYVAALRPGMLRLAGREADGAILNWLSAADVSKVVPEVGAGKAIVARIFVCPTDDAERARYVGRMGIAAYLNVGVYAAFHEWLGRGPLLQAMWTAWRAGDRKAALAAIPDEVVDELVVHGTAEECRAHVQRYVDNGVTIPVLALLPGGDDLAKVVETLAPGAT